nr:type II secretion system protein GspC [Myxococcota bacterium]
LAETNLQIKLLGTASGTDESARAAVEDLTSRSHQVVRVGDMLGGKAEVVRIERRRIVLRHNGRMEQLSLLEKDGGIRSPRPTAARRDRARPRNRRTANRPTRPTPSAADVDIQQLGDNRFALDRGDVEAAALNPAALFSQARILPKYEGGSMVGIQLNSIKEGSLFQQIGIQDGDTVTTVNGVEITGQQESAQVLRELTEASEFNVTVTGADGQERVLNYQVD